MTLDEVMGRTDDAVRHASAYWLATAHHVLTSAAAASPLTHDQRCRVRLIRAEMHRRDMPIAP